MNYMRKRKSFVRGLNNLINYTDINDGSIIEIGSYAGESTEIFAKSGKFKKIICIDPWVNGYDDKDGASFKFNMDNIFEEFKQRTSCYNFIEIIREFSTTAHIHISDKVDLVYIDGNHQYEAVKSDILLYSDKIKDGGYIAGHDYWKKSVKMAVNELLGEPLTVFSDHSWIFKIDKKN